MNKIGRKIFYDASNGNVIIDTGERRGSVVPTTIEQDMESYKVLSERTQESIDVIELEYGQFAQDFAECSGYRVNTETKTLEFSYPDPNAPEEPQPYQIPLTEQIAQKELKLKALEVKTQQLNEDLLAFMDYMTMGGM